MKKLIFSSLILSTILLLFFLSCLDSGKDKTVTETEKTGDAVAKTTANDNENDALNDADDQSEEIVLSSDAFSKPEIMNKTDAAKSLTTSKMDNFAMLLTDKPLKDYGVEKVMVNVLRVEVRFEAEDETETEGTESKYFIKNENNNGKNDNDQEKAEGSDTAAGNGKNKPDGSDTEVDDNDKEENEKDEKDNEECEENCTKSEKVYVLSNEPKVYNLLELQNDITAALGGGALPVGKYSHIRFILGDDSKITVNGEEQPLKIPSGTSSGLKIKGKFEVKEGEKYIITLDFDAEKSIHATGNGKFMMKPVITIKTFEKVVDEEKVEPAPIEVDPVPEEVADPAEEPAENNL